MRDRGNGSDRARGAATRRWLLIGAGVAVGLLFGLLAVFVAVSGIGPTDGERSISAPPATRTTTQ